MLLFSQPEALRQAKPGCNSADWILAAPEPYRHDARGRETHLLHVQLPGVVLPGLEVSLADLFQYRII